MICEPVCQFVIPFVQLPEMILHLCSFLKFQNEIQNFNIKLLKLGGKMSKQKPLRLIESSPGGTISL